MQHPSDISIDEFTYDLPQEKIATFPLEQRDSSKLLVYKAGEISESLFNRLPDFLEKESLLVFNTTRVVRARLNFLNSKGQTIEIFCLEPDSMSVELSGAMATQKTINWNCLVGNLKRWKEGELNLTSGELILKAKILEKAEQFVHIQFSWEPVHLSFSEVLERLGNIPIPPYLKRESQEIDQDRYQTIYAKQEGSVAAPTAGLHFTPAVLKSLELHSVSSLSVTLHVGAGTFKPVKSETMQGHDMHAEWLDVTYETIEHLAVKNNKKLIAVGTTSLRTLESLYWMGLKVFYDPHLHLEQLEIKQWEVYDLTSKVIPLADSLKALLTWMESRGMKNLVCHTQILIAPPYQLKVADGIITNFHQPKSTLLLLIAAVVGDAWKEIYDYALAHDFRFLSYGDSSLLLK